MTPLDAVFFGHGCIEHEDAKWCSKLGLPYNLYLILKDVQRLAAIDFGTGLSIEVGMT